MTKQKSMAEIEAGWHGLKRPKVNQTFKHYKGGEYIVVATGFLEDTEAPCVVYRSKEKNIVWVRSAKNFLELIEHDGRLQPRFSAL